MPIPARLFAFCCCLAATLVVGAQSREEARRDGRELLEVYIEKADAAQGVADWQGQAASALQAAMAAWERGAQAAGPEALAERGAVDADFRAELVRKWQDWLVKRFFAQTATPDAQKLLAGMGEQDNKYLFETDERGNLRRDQAGDPLLKGGAGADDDIAAWQNAVLGLKSQLLDSWQATVAQAMPELAADLSPEMSRAYVQSAAVAAAYYREAHGRELDALYRQQLARLTAARRYDQFSLRQKTEDRTAAAQADRLIAEVAQGTDGALEALRRQLGLGDEKVDASTAVDGADWRSSFDAALKSGLEQWDAAERRLLAQRSDWEQSTVDAFAEGDKQWEAAWEKLKAGQEAWQKEFRDLLRQGQETWNRKNAELAAEIAKAQTELDGEIANRASGKAEELSGLVDLYAEAVRAVGSAQDSGEFWLGRLLDPGQTGLRPDLNWDNLGSWGRQRADQLLAGKNSELAAATALRDGLAAFLTSPSQTWVRDPSVKDADPYYNSSSSQNRNPHYGYLQVYQWGSGADAVQSASLDAFKAKLAQLDARVASLGGQYKQLRGLVDQLGQALSGRGGLDAAVAAGLAGYEAAGADKERWTRDFGEAYWWLAQLDASKAQAAAFKANLDGSLERIVADDPAARASLQGVLDDLGAVDANYLDEYQVALLSAQAQALYWRRQLSIAQAVDDYARTHSADRPTDAQTQAAYADTLAAYQARQKDYQAAVDAMAAQGTAIAGRRDEAKAAQAAVEAAKAALAKAQGEYSAKLAVLNAGDASYFREQIGAFAKNLADYYGLLTDASASSRAALQARYRAALAEYGRQEAQRDAADAVQALVAGDKGQSGLELSLAELEKRVAGLAPESAWLSPDAALAVPADDPRSTTAGYILADWKAAAKAGSPRAEGLAAAYAGLVRGYQAGVREALAQRRAAVGLLVADDETAWKTGQGLGADGAGDLASAVGQLTRARLQTASLAYAAAVDPTAEADASARAYAALVGADPAARSAAAGRAAAAAALLRAGDAGHWWTDLAAHSADVRAGLDALDPAARYWLEGLLAGDGGIVVEGQDALSLIVWQPLATVDRIQGLWQVHDQFMGRAPCLAEARRTAAIQGIRAVLDGAALLQSGAAGLGLSAAALDARLRQWSAAGSIELETCSLVSSLRSYRPGLTASDQADLDALCQRIVDWSALRAAADGVAVGSADSAQASAALVAQSLNAKAALLHADRFTADQRAALWVEYAGRPGVDADAAASLRRMVVADLADDLADAYGADAAGGEAAWTRAEAARFDAAPAALKGLRAEALAQAKQSAARERWLADPAQGPAVDAQAAKLDLWRQLSTQSDLPAAALLSAARYEDVKGLADWIAVNDPGDAVAAAAYAAGLQGDAKDLSQRFFAAWAQRSAGQDAKRVLGGLALSGSTEVLAHIRGSGASAKLLERLFAFSVAGMLGSESQAAEHYKLLEDLVGFQSYGAAVSAFGDRPAGEAYAEAFEGYRDGDEAVRQGVLEWYLRRQLSQGDTAALARVGSQLGEQGAAEVAKFAAIARAARSFVRGVDDPAAWSAYIVKSDPGLDRLDLVQAVVSGAWDDPWFAVEAAAAESGVHAQDIGYARRQLRQGGQAAALALVCQGQVLGDLADLQNQYQAAAMVGEYRAAVQGWRARAASGDDGYRRYLAGNLAKPAGAADGAVFVSAAVDRLQADGDIDKAGQALAHAGDGWGAAAWANLLVDAQAAFQRETAAFASGLSAANAPDAQKLAADRAALKARYGQFAVDRTDWKAGDDFSVDAAVAAAAQQAAAALDQADQQASGWQSQIVHLGKGIADSDEASLKAALAKLKAELDQASARQDAAAARLQAAFAAVGAGMDGYNAAYADANRRWQALESARLAFDIQDRIVAYASGAYLSPDATGPPADQAGAYRSPAAELAYNLERSQRADKLLATLKAALPDAAERSAKTPPAAAWEASEKALLVLSEAQGRLDRETQAQNALAEARYGDWQEEAYKIVNPAAAWPKAAAAETNKDKSKDKGNEWTAYVALAADGVSLRLNVDGAGLLPGADADQQKALADYVGKSGHWDALDQSSLSGHLQAYLAELAALSARDAPNFVSMMYDFGLAADQYLREIQAKNPNLAKLLQDTVCAGGNRLSTDSNTLLDALVNDSTVNGAQDRDGYGANRDGAMAEVLAAQSQSLARLKADPEKWRLFQESLALRLSGMLRNNDYFDAASRVKAYQFLSGQMETCANALVWQGQTHHAASMIPLNPMAVWESCVWLTLTTRGSDMHSIAVLANQAANSNGTLVAQAIDGDGLRRTDQAWRAFDAAHGTLLAMQGTPAGGKLLDAAGLKASLRLANSQGKNAGAALPADLEGLVDRYFDQLADADRASSASAMAALVAKARAQRNADQSGLDQAMAAASGKAQEGIAAWDKAAADYLAKGGDADLAALAKGAFVDAPWSALGQARGISQACARLSARAEPGNEPYETERQAVIGTMASAELDLQRARLDHLKTLRTQEWRLRQQEVAERQTAWTDQMNQQLALADQQWSQSFDKFNTARQAWRDRMVAQYQVSTEIWDQAFAGFQTDRRDWVNELAQHAGDAIDPVTQNRLDGAAASAERKALSAAVAAQCVGMVDTQSILDEVLANPTLAAILRNLRAANQSVENIGTQIRQGVRRDVGSAAVQAAIAAFQNRQDKELAKHGALIVAAQAREVIERQRQATLKMVAGANSQFAGSMDHMFLGAGYSKAGGYYRRDSIRNTSLFTGTDMETQYVETYRAYNAGELKIDIKLDDESLAGLDANDVQSQIDVGIRQLANRQKEIFGEAGGKSKAVVIKINGGDGSEKAKLADMENTEQDLTKALTISLGNDSLRGDEPDQNIGEQLWGAVSSLWDSSDKRPVKGRTVVKSMGLGLFGEYLGYDTTFKDSPDADNLDQEAGYRNSILVDGKGEIGRLMGKFAYNQYRASAGFQKLSTPFYERRMWNDDGSSFKAFTISSVADLVISAVSLVNPVVGAVLGIAKAALIAVADVANGRPVGASLLKAACSAVGSVVGLATGGINLGSGVLGTVATGLVKSVINNAANSAMRSITIDEHGGLGFNTKTFINGVAGKQALTGYLSGMAAAATGEILGSIQGAFSTTSAMASLNGLVSATVGTAVTYGLTGKADFNLLNLASLGLKFKTKVKDANGNVTVQEKPLSMGILEMHLGADGFSMNIGSGGQDLTQIGTVLQNMDMIAYYSQKNYNILTNSKFGNFQDAMRYQYIYGNNDARSQADRLLSGEDDFRVSQGNAQAQTTNDTGKRMVVLNALLMNSPTLAAITLQHEAERDGWYTGQTDKNGHTVTAEEQQNETANAVVSHVLMAQRMKDAGITLDPATARDLLEYATGGISGLVKYSMESYDSTADYWKLTKDGKLKYDGNGYLRDEDGFYIDKNGNKTKNPTKETVGDQDITKGLLNILGMAPAQIAFANKWLLEAGMKKNKKNAWDDFANNDLSLDMGTLLGKMQSELVYKVPRSSSRAGNKPYEYPNNEVRTMKRNFSQEWDMLSYPDEHYANSNFATVPMEKTLKNMKLLGDDYFYLTNNDKNGDFTCLTPLGESIVNAYGFIQDSKTIVGIRQQYIDKLNSSIETYGDKPGNQFIGCFEYSKYSLGLKTKSDKAAEAISELAKTNQKYKKMYPDDYGLARNLPAEMGQSPDVTHCVDLVDEVVRRYGPDKPGYNLVAGSTGILLLSWPAKEKYFGPEGKPGFQNATQAVENLIKEKYFQTSDGAMAQALRNAQYIVLAGELKSGDNPGHINIVQPMDLKYYDPNKGPLVANAGQFNGTMSAAYAFFGAGKKDWKNIKYFVVGKY